MVGTPAKRVTWWRCIRAKAASGVKRGRSTSLPPDRSTAFWMTVWPKLWNRGSVARATVWSFMWSSFVATYSAL